ncbi:MAG: hypothetical protein KatS3mg122_1971 [Caldimonas sp.]|nr:MAG: hypothetical protein KatS3mg122_1971 [Caldimonas sp.]
MPVRELLSATPSVKASIAAQAPPERARVGSSGSTHKPSSISEAR